jgi:hypothetical protein
MEEIVMSRHNVGKGLRKVNILSWLMMGLTLTALPTRAEDPLLGEIKVIKCVGCTAGKVTLVVHDPIDIIDFEVTILDSDYGKIITPLPGKRVYDRGDGCFYWNETPKVAKKDTVKTAPTAPIMEPSKKSGLVKHGKKNKADLKDSAAVAMSTEPVAQETAKPDVVPSKCLPYERVPLPKLGKGD